MLKRDGGKKNEEGEPIKSGGDPHFGEKEKRKVGCC